MLERIRDRDHRMGWFIRLYPFESSLKGELFS